jgi:hypothetical protein
LWLPTPEPERCTCRPVAPDDSGADHAVAAWAGLREQPIVGLARLHDLGERILRRGEVAGPDPCAVGARYGMFSPAWHAGDDGPHPHPAREWIIVGWDLFFERVGADVGPAVAAVHDDPAGFGRKVAALGGPPTVLHGDAKPENLGSGRAAGW